MSELYKLQDDESKINFLRSIKDSIILKDIVKKYSIKDINLLDNLFFYLA
jgi:predicted AAA+ superfamily ATPase